MRKAFRFYSIGEEEFSYGIKTLREDRTAAERESCQLKRPAAGRKNTQARFFYLAVYIS